LSPDRAVLILARHKARQVIRQRYREAGRKLQSVRMAELRDDADVWLAAHPELIAQARELVSKSTLSAPRQGR
jgi:hypothetical protein